MRPRTQIALMRLTMFGGALLCFGIALALYTRFEVDLPGLPLWLNLAALVVPALAGMFLGYKLLLLIPLVCPSCRQRIERRRIEPTSRWRLPTYTYWCEPCQRDGLTG